MIEKVIKYACLHEGNGNLLQYSCLENPRNRGAWWAVVYGVAQSPIDRSNLAAAAANEFVLGLNLKETDIESSLGLHICNKVFNITCGIVKGKLAYSEGETELQ